jgi:rhomboid family GlyGly-CTERM serine protease
VSAWWRRPGRAWCAVAGLLALGSVWALASPALTLLLDWQPRLAGSEPWRAWSAAFVHYSALHVIGNAAGLAIVAAYGLASRVPARLAAAWFVAWPLTQLGLLVQPALAHYGGVSGVVHAGVAIVSLHLIIAGPRWLGALVFSGLVVKVLSESPWGPPLRHFDGFDIAIAPLAHASGLAAGMAVTAVAEALAALRRAPR